MSSDYERPDRNLTQDQRLLEQSMSDISEDAYCAGWMTDTEHAVWRLIHNGGSWGMQVYAVNDDMLEKVRRAMDVAGCWIVWDRSTMDQVAVPIDEWRAAHPVGVVVSPTQPTKDEK